MLRHVPTYVKNAISHLFLSHFILIGVNIICYKLSQNIFFYIDIFLYVCIEHIVKIKL